MRALEDEAAHLKHQLRDADVEVGAYFTMIIP